MRHFVTTLVLAKISLPLAIMAQTAPASAPAVPNAPAATAPAPATNPTNNKVAAKHHRAKKVKKTAEKKSA